VCEDVVNGGASSSVIFHHFRTWSGHTLALLVLQNCVSETTCQTICRQTNSQSVKSQTGQLAHWTTRWVDDSQTGQLADSKFKKSHL